MIKKQIKLIDMTRGGVAESLFRFALPLALGSVFQLFYSTTDVLFVGNLLGTSAAAAVGAGATLLTCLIGIFTGISAGTCVAVSNAIGADRLDEADKLTHTAIGFSILAGAALTVFAEIAAPSVLKLMNTPEEILPEAIKYIRIYFLSLIPLIIYNVGAGILRACGDSKRPFFVLAAGGFVNVFADFVFIAILKGGVAGAALATSISQTFSAAVTLMMLSGGNEKLNLNFKKIKVRKYLLSKILKLGLPAGIQSMMITVSNIFVQYYINGFGTDSISAYTYYFKLENFTYMPVLAFGQAIMTFTAANAGARRKERIKKGIMSASAISSFTVAVIALLILALGKKAFALFGDDMNVTKIGCRIIAVTFPFYWLNSLIEVFGGALRGMRKSVLSMVIVIITICIGRVILLNAAVRADSTIETLTAVYPITWSLAAFCLFLCAVFTYRKTDLKKTDS